jgi:hypothetical protein
MSEVIDAVNHLQQSTVDDSSITELYLRAIFPGKTTSFVADPLSLTEAANSSNLQGKGTIYALTYSPDTFMKLSDKHNSIACRPRRKEDNLELRTLVDIHTTALKVLGGDEVTFVIRPEKATLADAKWIHYNMRTAVSGTCNDFLPAGEWKCTYVICCGSYGEDLVPGAPNKFVLYNRM